MISNIINVDLFSVGVAVSANLILGSIIFFKDGKNVTNLLFFLQTIVLSLWSVTNYLSYKIIDPDQALFFVRLVMFFAVPNSIVFLLLVHTFPSSVLKMSRKSLVVLISLTVLTMGIALSPLLFSSVKIISGQAPQPVVGPGMIIFMPVAIFSVIVGIYLLVKRYRRQEGLEKLQLKYLLLGVIFMFILILFFDFLAPTFFQNTRFIPLSAVFTLPFVAFTAYAIFKHHLLDIKVVSTEVLTFILTVVTLFEVIISDNFLVLVFRSGVFLLVLSFGILLIKSVLREVRQREELERLNKEIETKNEQLEELSRFKTQLLSLASHQIKSPLAAIKGFGSILLQGLYGEVNDKVKDTLKKMMLSANELISLVNTLLDLRKVEEGKMEYKFEKVDLGALVTKVVSELEPLASGKNLSLTFEPPKEVVYVSADEQKLQQVIQNFIDNAIKYTPEGFVKARLETAGEYVSYVVEDSGLGVPADLLPHLFEEFVRDERVKKEILGTGFGLYIARKIVEAHGGTLWAESAGAGKGSKFSMKLRRIV